MRHIQLISQKNQFALKLNEFFHESWKSLVECHLSRDSQMPAELTDIFSQFSFTRDTHNNFYVKFPLLRIPFNLTCEDIHKCF